MNNVNDLNHTPTQPTISLSALTGTGASVQSTVGVNIDATNGLKGAVEVSAEAVQRPTIKINPNKKKVARRTVEDPSEVVSINPNDFIEKPKTTVKVVTLQDSAMTKLDAAVARKTQEYKDFVQNAIEDDKINRERVEAGLETVEGELKYLPNDLPQEVTKDPNPQRDPEPNKEDIEDDDIERDIDMELQNEELVAPTVARVEDPFAKPTRVVYEEPEVAQEEDIAEEEYEEEVEQETIDEEIAPVETVAEQAVPVEEEVNTVNQAIRNDITNGSIKITSQAISIDADGIENSTSSDFDIDAEDLDDVSFDGPGNEENLSDEELNQIAIREADRFKNEIMEKIVNVGKTLDTSSFIVSNKVISIKDAMKNTTSEPERIGVWPLTYAGRPFKASALKGPEVSLLADSDDSDRENSVGLTMPQLRIMYDHDANPYKPHTIEAWAKTIPFADVENIFAALYVASLKGANYVPMMCPKQACAYSYLTDDVDINKIVKFQNDQAKERFEKIKNIELTPENTGAYDSVVSIINDKFAVGLKLPSIYTILYEYASLNAGFIRKYTTVVSIIQYIDYIYKIDPETQSFQPIGWKLYPGDNAKTFKSKIATYAKILKEFDDTNFSILIALITTMINKASEMRSVSFEIPAAKCPKCGADIEAREVYARGLVFMRQRLVELATTPTEK